ncbi:MAG TPA: hypothetical protein VKB88_34000 [Bryobacteraceae bacterium]|nr:hypothetical protein [Bryobacteraceae bacterium]
MKYAKFVLSALALVFITMAAAPLASAQADHVRWDIASVPCSGPGGSYPCTFNPGGTAVATAMDCALTSTGFFGNLGCSTITLTGSGTFVAPASGGSSSAVTGGGTWLVTAADGTITKGTFLVTELIQFQKSEPLVLPAWCGTCETTDNIGDLDKLWGGVAVVRVAYSDGTTGVLTFACSALPDPPAVAEGVLATKPVIMSNVVVPGLNSPPLPSYFPTSKVLLPVLFWNPGLDQYTVEFHLN